LSGARFGLPKLGALKNAATKIPQGLAGLSDDAARLSHNAARQSDELLELAVKSGRTRIAAPYKALRVPTTDAGLAGTRILGYTTPNGRVFLQSGLSRAEQVATLRHEGVHAFFSPKGTGPMARARQALGQWGYDNSQLLRFIEEAIAETRSSGSLIQGLRHPLVNGYGITLGGLAVEGTIYGGSLFGLGYAGYRLGGGE
jgi:hypothetical protein